MRNQRGKHRIAVAPANLNGACTMQDETGIFVDRGFTVRVHRAFTVALETGTPLDKLLPTVCNAVNNAGLPVLADSTDVERVITYLEELPAGNKFHIELPAEQPVGV